MAIEHKDIEDPQLHEPKEIAAANNGEVYVADGALSGNWERLPSSSIDTTGAVIGQLFVADGSGSGDWEDSGGTVYGQMDILNNTTIIVLPANIDFDDPTNYSQVTGIWSAPLSLTNSGISFSSDSLTVPLDGTYRIEFWTSFTIPNNSDVAFKFAINGTKGPSKVKRSATSSTDYGLVNGHSLIELVAGDIITVWAMSNVAGNILMENGVFLVQLVNP